MVAIAVGAWTSTFCCSPGCRATVVESVARAQSPTEMAKVLAREPQTGQVIRFSYAALVGSSIEAAQDNPGCRSRRPSGRSHC